MAGLLTKAYREQVLHETPQTKKTQAKQQNRDMEMEQAVRERQQTRERWELSTRGGDAQNEHTRRCVVIAWNETER